MQTCCCCLTTSTGTMLTSFASLFVAANIVAYNAHSLIHWESERQAVYSRVNMTGYPRTEENINNSLKVTWWKTLITVVLSGIFLLISVFTIIGVRVKQHKLLVPWLMYSIILVVLKLIDILVSSSISKENEEEPGYYDGREGPITSLLELILFCVWTYGFWCTFSFYRTLKKRSGNSMLTEMHHVNIQ